MLPLALVEEIRRLLDEEQLSYRKIAHKLGVSRGTIGAIATGRRGMHGREPASDDLSIADLQLVPERCRGCGGMVYKPCLLCRARAVKRRQRPLRELHERPRRVA